VKKVLLFIFILTSNISFCQTQIGQDIDGEEGSDHSGKSVSLSSDGSIIAIGAPYNNENGDNSGHVRVYKNVSGNWVQIGQDINGEEEQDNSGWSVSLSSDGSIVAIGAPFSHGNGDNAGHVRVYENVSGSWVQIGQDIDGEEGGDNSGWSVNLSSNGSIVAIGAAINNENGTQSGHVRVYENISGSWVQIGQDINGEGASDRSGASISLSSDGSIVAIGAIFNNNGNGDGSGHVRVYKNISGSWVQIGQDIDGESAYDESGKSVSLSSDGSIVAIGAPNNDGNGGQRGYARVYKNVSGSWIQIGQDIDGESAYDNSGESVSLSSDGSIIAIGTPFNNENGNNAGHVRVFKNISDNWTQIGTDIDGESVNDRSGTSISLSNNGSILAIGAPFNTTVQNGNTNFEGHARVFDLNGILNIENFKEENYKIYPNPTSKNITIQLLTGELKNITIYNNLGQKILSKKSLEVNVENLKPGIYFIKIETNNKRKATKKLFIE
jgi:hypothetical protein